MWMAYSELVLIWEVNFCGITESSKATTFSVPSKFNLETPVRTFFMLLQRGNMESEAFALNRRDI
tara:strand:+ start:242 stop:436 length:195 start_codon:yes stop_codon:yes gene_type:complete